MNLYRACVRVALTAFIFAAFEGRAHPVASWNEAARAAFRAERSNPPRATRVLSMLHLAIYDAVNGIQRTHRPYHVTEMAPPGCSLEAAVSGAAYEVLLQAFPDRGIQTTNFGALYTNLVAALPATPATQDGLAWGKGVATAYIQLRANDGATNAAAYTPGTLPGEWRPTPPGNGAALLPGWGKVTPFAMTSLRQFEPYAPAAVTTANYAFEMNLVKAYGAATGSLRTPDHTEIAEFWANGAGTETPPGHWNRIAVQVAAAQNLDVVDTARLMALLNIAQADAAICCWETKFTFNLWRPITAIREADNDDNPGTTGDPNWSPLLATPPFPEYTSGHSTFSRAAATVMARFFGTDAIPFTTGSDGLPGVTRSYPGFGAAADESGLSRIFGGIHFPSANIAGQTAGHLLAAHVMDYFLVALDAATFVLVAPTGADVHLKLRGEAGRRYTLEAGADLSNWSEVGTTTADAAGDMEFVDTGAAGEAKRFYRAVAR